MDSRQTHNVRDDDVRGNDIREESSIDVITDDVISRMNNNLQQSLLIINLSSYQWKNLNNSLKMGITDMKI